MTNETVQPICNKSLSQAELTSKGEAVVNKAFEANLARFRSVFASLSSTELTSLMELLHRIREGFPAPP
jgi:hypothetical protein